MNSISILGPRMLKPSLPLIANIVRVETPLISPQNPQSGIHFLQVLAGMPKTGRFRTEPAGLIQAGRFRLKPAGFSPVRAKNGRKGLSNWVFWPV